VHIARDLDLLVAVVIGIAALGAGLLLRGALRFVLLVVGLLIAAYVAGLLPGVRLPRF
jgi:hypothetical protein